MSINNFDSIIGSLSINSYSLFEDISDSLGEDSEYISKAMIMNINITNVYNLIVSDIFDITSNINSENVSVMAIDFIENLVYRNYNIVLDSITTYMEDNEDIYQNILNIYGQEYTLISKIETRLLINLINDKYIELKMLLNKMYKYIPKHELCYTIPMNTKNINGSIVTYVLLSYGDINA